MGHDIYIGDEARSVLNLLKETRRIVDAELSRDYFWCGAMKRLGFKLASPVRLSKVLSLSEVIYHKLIKLDVSEYEHSLGAQYDLSQVNPRDPVDAHFLLSAALGLCARKTQHKGSSWTVGVDAPAIELRDLTVLLISACNTWQAKVPVFGRQVEVVANGGAFDAFVRDAGKGIAREYTALNSFVRVENGLLRTENGMEIPLLEGKRLMVLRLCNGPSKRGDLSPAALRASGDSITLNSLKGTKEGDPASELCQLPVCADILNFLTRVCDQVSGFDVVAYDIGEIPSCILDRIRISSWRIGSGAWHTLPSRGFLDTLRSRFDCGDRTSRLEISNAVREFASAIRSASEWSRPHSLVTEVDVLVDALERGEAVKESWIRLSRLVGIG